MIGMSLDHITIVSHADTHTTLSEICGFRRALEDTLGKHIKYFAYQRGKRKDFTRKTMKMVRDAGYKAAFSSKNGRTG